MMMRVASLVLVSVFLISDVSSKDKQRGARKGRRPPPPHSVPGLFVPSVQLPLVQNNALPVYKLDRSTTLFAYNSPTDAKIGAAGLNDTVKVMVRPDTVELLGVNLLVIQPDETVQVLEIGTCARVGLSLDGNRTCVQRYSVTKLLVDDGAGPVDFVSVEVPSACECVTNVA